VTCHFSNFHIDQVQSRAGLLRPRFRERRLGYRRGALRRRIRHPGPGAAGCPRDRLQSTRVGHSALSSAPYRQRDLRGHPQRPGDHHPSAESVLRADRHRTHRRRIAAFSQRRQHGSYKDTYAYSRGVFRKFSESRLAMENLKIIFPQLRQASLKTFPRMAR